jgi:hypothetical protein
MRPVIVLTSDLVLAVKGPIARFGVKNVRLPEEIIVFDAGGPIRGETVLKAHADHSAPTGPLCLPEADAGEGIEDVEALACDGSAALVSLLPNAG